MKVKDTALSPAQELIFLFKCKYWGRRNAPVLFTLPVQRSGRSRPLAVGGHSSASYKHTWQESWGWSEVGNLGEERPFLSHPRGTVHRGHERDVEGPLSPCVDISPSQKQWESAQILHSYSPVRISSPTGICIIFIYSLNIHSMNICKASSVLQIVDHIHGMKKHSYEREAESRLGGQEWNRA